MLTSLIFSECSIFFVLNLIGGITIVKLDLFTLVVMVNDELMSFLYICVLNLDLFLAKQKCPTYQL